MMHELTGMRCHIMTRKMTSISHALLDSDTYADMTDSQRSIWLCLILISDDWGRFPYNLKKLARKLSVIQKTPEEIEQTIDMLMADGCLIQYYFGESDDYRTINVCQWMKWELYQGKLSWRDHATLPNLDGEYEKSTNPKSNAGLSRTSIARTSTVVTVDSRRNCTKLKEELNSTVLYSTEGGTVESEFPEVCAFVQELFPDKWHGKELKAQRDALRLICQHDCRDYVKADYAAPNLLQIYEKVFQCLRWASTDTGDGNWPGWSVQFNSFRALRVKKQGVSKFEKIWASYQASLRQTEEEDSNKHLPKYVDHEACDREEREVNERIARENREADEQRRIKNTTA